MATAKELKEKIVDYFENHQDEPKALNTIQMLSKMYEVQQIEDMVKWIRLATIINGLMAAATFFIALICFYMVLTWMKYLVALANLVKT